MTPDRTEDGPRFDPASFRDPSGTVLSFDRRVFRSIRPDALQRFNQAKATGVLDRLMADGRIVPTRVVPESAQPRELQKCIAGRSLTLLEHERIPFISYPYEWPFSLLQRAALHHLDLQLDLLRQGFTLCDASAFNIQFISTRPVFIDILSIHPYREGDYWVGYRQFCEQFLGPLLLMSSTGVPFHPWLRGAIEGLPVEHLARLLPARMRLSWRALIHVSLHAKLSTNDRASIARRPLRPLPKRALLSMLTTLRSWIAALKAPSARTAWQDYETSNPYSESEATRKRACIEDYVRRLRPVEIFDLGCNRGAYSEVALSSGAKRAIGFDTDLAALEAAVERADAGKLDFLPLVQDAANPSPDQGWDQSERPGFRQRAKSDGVLALALLHHVTFGRNVPIARTLRWITDLAPSGVIEFVPKSDPMVQRMLAHRDDIFEDYTIDHVRAELAGRGRIIHEDVVSASGRTLFTYQREADR